MRPFGEWLMQPVKTEPKENRIIKEYHVTQIFCCQCDGLIGEIDIEDFDEDTKHHCGRSPRCCP